MSSLLNNEYDVDGSDLVVVHVDKAIRLFRQLVALCDVTIPDYNMLSYHT